MLQCLVTALGVRRTVDGKRVPFPFAFFLPDYEEMLTPPKPARIQGPPRKQTVEEMEAIINTWVMGSNMIFAQNRQRN